MELWLTYGFCSIAVVLAIAFALIKHPVHAALSFACVVLATAGVYMLQDAAFVAASTVVVYAGATIIIFMFVLMFAQQTNLLDYDTHKQNPLAAGVVAIVLAATVIAVALKEFPTLEAQLAAKNPVAEVAAAEPAEIAKPDGRKAKATEVIAAKADRFSVAKLGAVFYTRYLLAIEIAGTLLLVATIGAVLIAQREPNAGAKETTKS